MSWQQIPSGAEKFIQSSDNTPRQPRESPADRYLRERGFKRLGCLPELTDQEIYNYGR